MALLTSGVPAFRSTFNWLLVAVWMSFIFIGSTGVLSSQHTSRFLGPFLHWLIPGFSAQNLETVQYFIRKCGHVSEYAVLAILVWNARRSSPIKRTFWQCAKFAIFVAAFYAATDEFHQSFEPTREASVIDVGIDTCGATAGMLFLWTLGRWRKAW